MRIGDKMLCQNGPAWAKGHEAEIKGIIRDYRTIKDNTILDQMGGVRDSDQVIFSILDTEGFRYSSPDGRPTDFITLV